MGNLQGDLFIGTDILKLFLYQPLTPFGGTKFMKLSAEHWATHLDVIASPR